ncbi:hypothetical protein PYW07_009266 [Mythimna separata]|uniref:Uncharacterized protein n=1 Tax=Mythimna separata TaxID=271217 RepID=A0AAD7YBY7_MYTSE|nr:hypothetical protein PYW07_009266 [Mythimna separata]
MQAGVFGGICLLAFLLSEGRAEELELSKDANALQDEDKAKDNISLRKSGDLEVPSDLKNELSLGVAQTNFRANEGRSGDITESDGRRDSAISNAIAKSDGDGSASAYANSFSDSAQSAKARGASFNPFNEELGPYKPPGSSLSQADGQVTNSNPYDQRFNYPYPQSYPYQPEADNGLYQPSPNANLETDTGSYQRDPGYNPYGQGFNPAQVKNQADNGLFRQDRTYDTYGSELSTGQVQNQADNGLYQPGYNIQPNVNPYSQGSSFPQESGQGDRGEAAPTYSDSKPAASASTNVNSQGRYSNEYPSESPVRPGGYNPAEPQAPKQPDVNTSGQSLPIAFEDAESRVILPHEYVFPNKMPGGENVIQCTKENEFHHFWSRELECLVCICLNEYGVLQPVCASCGGCQNPPPKLPEIVPRLPESITVLPANPEPFEPIPMMPEPIPTVPQPEPTPEPFPVYPTPEPVTYPPAISFPEPVATLPPPPESARCNPLPTGVPFTNPLHPCQLCICRESLVSGKIDVQIQCKDNPQCIAPTDVTALPPIPDVPVPIPLPICEKFPEDVLFPHPTETCKLCKCAKSLSEEGIVEQQITCYPHPDCVPKVEPITEPAVPSLPIPVDPNQVKPTPEPTVLPPLREPNQTMEPVPLPEVVTVEPLPWPPITTTTPLPELPPPKPGPLPGPSPHESCRPFPPNQTFQHPWDDCQVCVCTEATAVGLITVEVNCYTKASCCIEPPDSVKEVNPGLTKKYVEPLNAVNSADGSQPATSTNKAPSAYPVSYSSPSGSVYPGSKPAADPLSTPSIVPYSSFVDHSSSYPYQPNYAAQYSQYSEYPPRLPVLPGTANNFGYPANYQYAQGDAVGNNYLPQGHFQPFDPRFQTVPAPSYPGMYQRAYDRPMFPPQLRDNYVKPPIPAIGGPGVQNLAPNFGLPQAYSKDRSGKADGPDDNSR